MLKEAEILKLVDKIVKQIRPEKIILFGSYAKGLATLKSDLDLFIIKESLLSMSKRMEEIRPLWANLLIGVDAHVYTPEEVEEFGVGEYSFVRSVLNYGITVYPVAHNSPIKRCPNSSIDTGIF